MKGVKTTSSDRTIQSTTDYTMFKYLNSNRRLSKPHVKRLVAAFEMQPRSNVYNPVLVNENFEVIDGQHRIAALSELKMPVHFIVGEGLNIDDAQQINAGSKAWSPMDYARSFSAQGKKAYDVYIDFKEKYKFNHDVLLRLMALDEPITTEAFKRGRLHVTNKARATEIAKVLVQIVKLTGIKHRSLAFALEELFDDIENKAEFLHYLAAYYEEGKQIPAFKDVADYKRELLKFI